jgi:hypothetical protein
MIDTDEQKINLLNSVSDDVLYAISKKDVQAEAIDRFGRLLTDDEINEVQKKLSWGIGESMNTLYASVLKDL